MARVCEQLREIPELKHGYNAVGFSQGRPPRCPAGCVILEKAVIVICSAVQSWFGQKSRALFRADIDPSLYWGKPRCEMIWHAHRRTVLEGSRAAVSAHGATDADAHHHGCPASGRVQSAGGAEATIMSNVESQVGVRSRRAVLARRCALRALSLLGVYMTA